MRNGQNKRMRGRNRKSHNPLTRVYESNGPDVKIRGTASHVAEKYMQLARDAQASGDPVSAENYFQHAEHYFRLIATAQEQFRQNQPLYQAGAADSREDYDDGDDDVGAGQGGGDQQPVFGTRDPQPYLPRDAQFFAPRDREQNQSRQQQGGHQRFERQDRGERHERGERGDRNDRVERNDRGERNERSDRVERNEDDAIDRLPAFVTGGGAPAPAQQSFGPNSFEGQAASGGGDRFPLHRRRRRHRGNRGDAVPAEAAEEGAGPAQD